jgi:hypothetical protein
VKPKPNTTLEMIEIISIDWSKIATVYLTSKVLK